MNNFLNFVAHDFPFLTTNEMLARLSAPQIWTFHSSEGFGAYTVSILWNWPLNLLIGVLAQLGLSHNLIMLITFIVPTFLIGYYSISRLLKEFKFNKTAVYIGSLVFLFNSYLLMVIDGGQFSIGLAYAIFPLVYLKITTALNDTFYKKIIASLLTALLSIFDIRFIFILVILLFIRFIFNIKNNLKNIASWFATGLVIGSVLLLLNAYWIMPAVLSQAPTLPANYDSLSQLSELSFANVGHATLFMHPHWFKNIFGQITDLSILFIFYPIAAFTGLLFGNKSKYINREIGFYLLLLIISIIFIKGDNEPLNIYPFLFEKVPGFSLFRDPTKFFVLLSISYSVLIANLANKLNKKFIYVFLLFIFLLIIPILRRETTGVFSSPKNIEDFKNINEILEEDQTFGRILWLPSRHKYGHSSEIHPAIEGLRIAANRTFAIGRVGIYEQFNFIRDAKFMNQIFDLTGIEYIAFPKDTNKDLKKEEEDYYRVFKGQLSNLDWLDQVYESDVLQLYKNQEVEDKFFLTKKSFVVNNSDKIFSRFDNKLNLSDNALFFENKFKNEKIISLAKIIPPEPDFTGWWSRKSDFIWVRDFLEQKYKITNQDFDYGYGYAFAEGDLSLSINDDLIESNEFLYARVLKNSLGGGISFFQGNNLISKINTKDENPEIVVRTLAGFENIEEIHYEYADSKFEWIKIGKLILDRTINVRTFGELNVVNALMISDKDLDLTTFNEFELVSENNTATLNYKMLNPTHYVLNISGLKNNSTLVFSERFDKNWIIYSDNKENYQNSREVYSLFNSFEISEDGQYNIYYLPQYYANIGFLISLVSFILIISYIIGYEFKHRKHKKHSKN